MRTPRPAISACLICLLLASCIASRPAHRGVEGELASRARDRMASGDYMGALAALHPLPDAPESERDRLCLALAGEALLNMGDSSRAESALAKAVAGLEPRPSSMPWLAAAYANLGKACLAGHKPEQATRAYALAAATFDEQGFGEKSAECVLMAQEIERVLGKH